MGPCPLSFALKRFLGLGLRARARGGLEIVAPSLAGISISCGGDHMILKIENAAIKPAVFVYRLAKKFLRKTVVFLAG